MNVCKKYIYLPFLFISFILSYFVIYNLLDVESELDIFGRNQFLSSRNGYTLMLRGDGTVYDWDAVHRNIPPGRVIGLYDIVAVASGERAYGLALNRDGYVYIWGYEYHSQLWSLAMNTLPTRIYGLSNVKDIVACRDFAVFLKEDGSIWTLVPPIESTSHTSELRETGIVDVYRIVGRGCFAFAIKYDGTLIRISSCGNTDELGTVGTIQFFYANAYFMLVVDNHENAHIWCRWGSPQGVVENFFRGIKMISESFVLTQDGSIWKNTVSADYTPMLVFNEERIASISGNVFATFDGVYYYFGVDQFGQFLTLRLLDAFGPENNISKRIVPQLRLAENVVTENFYIGSEFKEIETFTVREVALPQYTFIDRFHEGLAFADNGRYWGFIDTFGNEVIPFRFLGSQVPNQSRGFRDGLALVYVKDNGYAFINKNGEIVLALFDYEYVFHFSEGLAAVYKAGYGFGFINTDGDVVIPYSFFIAHSFSDGLAAVIIGDCINEHYRSTLHFIDLTGNIVIPNAGEVEWWWSHPMWGADIRFTDGFFRVHSDGWGGIIDTNGSFIYPLVQSHLLTRHGGFRGASGYFQDGVALFSEINMGYFDVSGDVIIDPIFQQAHEFSEGLALVRYNNQDLLINQSGEIVLYIDKWVEYFEIYANITNYSFLRKGPFGSNGLASFGFHGFSGSHNPGAVGFINTSGQTVIAPMFDGAGHFHGGLAMVSIGNAIGFIDSHGNEVIPIIYDFTSGSFWWDVIHEGTVILRLNGEHRVITIYPLSDGSE